MSNLKKELSIASKYKSGGGVSLYLAFMIMTMLLAIAFGLSTIFLGQTKMIRTMGYSVTAFYAADAGIERILMDRESPIDLSDYLDLNDNGVQDDDDSFYDVSVFSSDDPACPADNFCIKSIGKYKETRRAIEIQY